VDIRDGAKIAYYLVGKISELRVGFLLAGSSKG